MVRRYFIQFADKVCRQGKRDGLLVFGGVEEDAVAFDAIFRNSGGIGDPERRVQKKLGEGAGLRIHRQLLRLVLLGAREPIGSGEYLLLLRQGKRFDGGFVGDGGFEAGGRILLDHVRIHEPTEHGTHALQLLLLGERTFLPAGAEFPDGQGIKLVQKLLAFGVGKFLEGALQQFQFAERGRLELPGFAIGNKKFGSSFEREVVFLAIFDFTDKFACPLPASRFQTSADVGRFDNALAPDGTTAFPEIPVVLMRAFRFVPAPESEHALLSLKKPHI